MTKRKQRHVSAFAILRVNEHLSTADARERVSVVRIVWTRERAESEVDRLNAAGSSRRAWYFWQSTRAERE